MSRKNKFRFLTFIIIFFISFIACFAEDKDKSFESINLETINQNVKEQGSQLSDGSLKLTLKKALDIAMQNNRSVKEAISTLPVSEASLIIAKYFPNPTFGANTEFVKQGSIHPGQLGQNFELNRARHWRITIAKEQISKTELEIAKVLWEVHTQVHIGYSALSTGLAQFNLAKARADFYKSLLDIAQKKSQAGDISQLELNRAKMEYVVAQNDLDEAEKKLKRAKIDFNHLLGTDDLHEEVITTSIEELKPKIKVNEYQPLEKVLEEASSKRLEFAILEKEFGITRAQLKKAKWERIPVLYIEGGPARPNYHDNIWGPYFGTQFELPIFNRRQGEIKQAKAQIEHLEKQRERLKQDISAEATNALQDLELSEKQVFRFLDQLLNQSQDILEKIKEGYKGGKLSLTDVLNAEQRNRDLNQDYLNSLFNYQYSLASLEYAVGVPLYGLSEQ